MDKALYRRDLILLQYIFLYLRWALFPFLSLIMPLFVPSLRKRRSFEGENLKDSFSWPKGEVADLAFEVSSEGEFEQVAPLLNVCLENGLKVEVFYASSSLENKIQRFAKSWPGQVRPLRMPILSCFPWPVFGGQNFFRMITAKKLVLCRYDFFPELLIYGQKEGVEFILASATLKGKEHILKREGAFFHHYFRGLFLLFDFIFTATEIDGEKFKKLGVEPEKVLPFDLRVLQIEDRIQKSERLLGQFPEMKDLKSFIETHEERRVLMGSCWPQEMEVFSDPKLLEMISKKEFLFFLAPHKLNKEFLEELNDAFDSFKVKNVPLYFVDLREDSDHWEAFFKKWNEKPGPVVLTTPAILLEMYSLFSNVFVGGGHGRSIHSVLEPFLAGSQVFCGPKTHRSTEYDLIQDISPNSIFIVHELGMFASILFKQFQNVQSLKPRAQLVSLMSERFSLLLKLFGLRKEEKC